MTQPASALVLSQTGQDESTLLATRGLSVSFPTPVGPVAVLDRVDLSIGAGQTTGLIGESGSGKSMLARAIIGLLPPKATTEGEILLRGENLLDQGREERRHTRGHEISMIFQDPLSSLNPVQKIWKQVTEINRHEGASRAECRAKATELLADAGIPDAAARLDAYPHEFSGGLRQRAMIALALAGSPSLLLADEPTTALDVTVQARILNLLKSLQEERRMSMLLVSHDLRVVSHVAHQITVMYCGRICESGPTAAVIHHPAHPYTKALAGSIPSVHRRTLLPSPLPGSPASPYARPAGCAFHPRCPFARECCATVEPEPREIAPGRTVSCHFAEEVLR